MKIRRLYQCCTLVLAVQLGQYAFAQNAAGSHWVATWASSQQQRRAAPPRPQATPAPSTPPPVARFSGSFDNQTVRMIVRTSIGGHRLRVQLANTYGAAPLVVGAAHIALHGKDSAIVPASDHALLFDGKPSCTIPPGAPMLSDPLDFDVPELTDLAVSIFVPGDTGLATTHSLGLHTTYISKEGNFVDAPEIADPVTSQSWYWVASVDVLAPADAAAVVTFGDSITDGATSTPNTDRSWPSLLAPRLLANAGTADIAVVNQGISGNRVLGDGAGVSALARFDRDVIAQAGVKWVMILEGINDIGLGARANAPPGVAVTAGMLIGAMRQMIERAHIHGIKVIGCTLTPYGGAGYSSEAGEAIREAVNTWIRTGGSFDGVADFEAAVRDPAAPTQFRAEYNNTDHLHPNDAGYKAMADSVDLSIFAAQKAAPPAGRKK